MTTRTFKLRRIEDRARAARAVAEATWGDTVTITGPLLTPEQSRKFHAICSDLEKSGFTWKGTPRSKAAWKMLLISGHAVATGDGHELMEGLEGELINLRESVATMERERGSSLIEYAVAFCAINSIPDRQHRSVIDRAVSFHREARAPRRHEEAAA